MVLEIYLRDLASLIDHTSTLVLTSSGPTHGQLSKLLQLSEEKGKGLLLRELASSHLGFKPVPIQVEQALPTLALILLLLAAVR